MSIIYNLGIYMLASSFIMIAYVWINHIRHIRSGYDQMQENDLNTEDNLVKKSLAA